MRRARTRESWFGIGRSVAPMLLLVYHRTAHTHRSILFVLIRSKAVFRSLSFSYVKLPCLLPSFPLTSLVHLPSAVLTFIPDILILLAL
jgi:hypothetical protein